MGRRPPGLFLAVLDLQGRTAYRRHVGYRACSCFIILVALALVSARPRVAQAADYSATYEPGVVARVVAGQTFTVPVRVTNTGTLVWRHSGRCAAVLGYHWYQGATRVAFDAQGTPPPSPVAPGQSIDVSVTVTAPDAPGSYIL